MCRCCTILSPTSTATAIKLPAWRPSPDPPPSFAALIHRTCRKSVCKYSLLFLSQSSLSLSISQTRRLVCSAGIVPEVDAWMARYGSSGASGEAAPVYRDYLEFLGLVYKSVRELEWDGNRQYVDGNAINKSTFEYVHIIFGGSST